MPPKKPRMMAKEDSDSDDEMIVTKKVVERIGPYEEELALRNIAQTYRLRHDQPSPLDVENFPDIEKSRDAEQFFMHIRNAALTVWYGCRTEECTAEAVLYNLFPPYDSDVELVQKVVQYMSRAGIINYGKYTRKTSLLTPIPKENKVVMVIGAGASGVAAATKLHDLGFNVVMLEARDCIGGRCQTIVKPTGSMEIGCDSLRNLDTSPMGTLLRQINVTHYSVEENEDIYKDGIKGDPKNRLINGLYRNMKMGLANFSHAPPQRSEDGLYVSRQGIYENMYNMVERNTLVNYHNFAKINAELSMKRQQHYNNMKHHRNTALMAQRKLEHTPQNEKLVIRSLKVDMKKCMERFEVEAEAFERTETQLAEHLRNRSCKQYMVPEDYRNYNFFLGQEELLAGAILEKLQYSVNTNESSEPGGAFVRVKEGIQHMLEDVMKGKRIQLRKDYKVMEIDSSADSTVRLRCQLKNGKLVDIKAACVVCTIPIGVLKRTIRNDDSAPIFTPPLPEDKVEGIRCLGSGLINKVILEFEYSFWNNDEMVQFGVISSLIQERGEMISWSSLPDSKFITATYVGEDVLHRLSDDELVDKAMKVLRGIFTECPEIPVSAHCTRWHDDELACGTGSFMSLRTEPHHFDAVRKPLKTKDGVSRVYFAGEHTSETDYGTIDGAWWSGLRAAADIANDRLGRGLLELTEVPIVSLSPASSMFNME